MTGQRQVDPLAAIFIRQNQSGNGQWAKTGISEAEQRRKNTRQGSRSQAQVHNSKVRQSGVKHRDSRMRTLRNVSRGKNKTSQ